MGVLHDPRHIRPGRPPDDVRVPSLVAIVVLQDPQLIVLAAIDLFANVPVLMNLDDMIPVNGSIFMLLHLLKSQSQHSHIRLPLSESNPNPIINLKTGIQPHGC